MDLLIVGLGSMGKRRLELLQEIGCGKIIGVDTKAERRKEVEERFGVPTRSDIKSALADYPETECAFICTSPLSHNEIISDCLKKKLHVFTEINLVPDGYERNIRLAEQQNRVLFLSSTFLYRKEICFLQKELSLYHGNVNYIYHVGQYLPDWHPWEKITDFFVGDKRTNGCREIFAIELPWITQTFGEIEKIETRHDKIGILPISYDDNYLVEITHENGNKGLVAVDVISPKAVRNLELYGEGLYLVWDGTPGGLKKYNQETRDMEEICLYDGFTHKDSYQPTIIEDAYVGEIRDFFKIVRGVKEQEYGFEKDLKVLHWIDRIEA